MSEQMEKCGRDGPAIIQHDETDWPAGQWAIHSFFLKHSVKSSMAVRNSAATVCEDDR
jgi:hypothetical protein